MFNLDQAITEWRRRMLAAGIKTPAPMNELEGHLRDDVEQQVRSGLTEEQAFAVAIKQLGPAHALKPEFKKVSETRLLRLHKSLWPALGIGLGLFVIGAGFFYFAVLPLALRASDQYNSWLGLKTHQWVTKEYYSFVSRFIVGVGLGLGMPIGLLVLIKCRRMNYSKLVSLRRYFIVINFILGAVVTTPEVVAQIMMFVPLQLLFEASVWIARSWERKEANV